MNLTSDPGTWLPQGQWTWISAVCRHTCHSCVHKCRKRCRFRLMYFWQSYCSPSASSLAGWCVSCGRRTVATENARTDFQRFWNQLQLEWGDERKRTVSHSLIQCPWPCQRYVMDRRGLTCIKGDSSNWSWRYVSRHSWDILWTTERRTIAYKHNIVQVTAALVLFLGPIKLWDTDGPWARLSGQCWNKCTR